MVRDSRQGCRCGRASTHHHRERPVAVWSAASTRSTPVGASRRTPRQDSSGLRAPLPPKFVLGCESSSYSRWCDRGVIGGGRPYIAIAPPCEDEGEAVVVRLGSGDAREFVGEPIRLGANRGRAQRTGDWRMTPDLGPVAAVLDHESDAEDRNSSEEPGESQPTVKRRAGHGADRRREPDHVHHKRHAESVPPLPRGVSGLPVQAAHEDAGCEALRGCY